uniref:Uncharacterized protein n=1 Tax=Schizaphis graminum TaxID=13262 RepID=A0A2S2PC69_SCHGA
MNNKLNEIKGTIEKWNNPMSLKRREEVVLNHLRIGHTHHTHGHLMKKEPPKICAIICRITTTIITVYRMQTQKRHDSNSTFRNTAFTTHWALTKNPSKI